MLVSIHTWNLEKEHPAHMEHLIAENGGEKPEKIMYDYLNVRKNSYPCVGIGRPGLIFISWGNQSLFFNPEHNVMPLHSFTLTLAGSRRGLIVSRSSVNLHRRCALYSSEYSSRSLLLLRLALVALLLLAIERVFAVRCGLGIERLG